MRLTNGAMKVETMRHDGTAEDRDGEVEHEGIGEQLLRRNVALQYQETVGLRVNKLEGEAHRYDHHQDEYHHFIGFLMSTTPPFEYHQCIQRGDKHAVDQRDPKKKVERDGGTNNLEGNQEKEAHASLPRPSLSR